MSLCHLISYRLHDYHFAKKKRPERRRASHASLTIPRSLVCSATNTPTLRRAVDQDTPRRYFSCSTLTGRLYLHYAGPARFRVALDRLEWSCRDCMIYHRVLAHRCARSLRSA